MKRKRIELLKTEAAMMVGMSGVPDGHMREFTQAMTESAMFYGYYRGLGFSEKASAEKAKKCVEHKG